MNCNKCGGIEQSIWACDSCWASHSLIGENHGKLPTGEGHYRAKSKCPICNGTGRYTVAKKCSHQKGAVHYY